MSVKRLTEARVRSVLAGYIGPILVDAVLRRAVETQQRSKSPTMSWSAIVEDCMVGLRMFVREGQLPALMLELAELLEDE